MYRSIIVPLDGSARSQAALGTAARLAVLAGATLDLVRVHLDDRPDLEDDPSWDAMFREGELRHLEALALAYEPIVGAPIAAALLDGSTVDALLEFSGSRVAPLFIMVGRGRTGLRRALLGSTADGLIRRGTAPVLVLRDRGPDRPPSWKLSISPFSRIVLPLDGSSHAESGIPHAIAIAAATGAKLHLVRVVGPIATSAVFGAFAMHPIQPYDEATTIRHDVAREYLDRIVGRIATAGVQVDVDTEVSLSTDPASAVIESCRRTAADLVVVPTHGRGASRLIVGSLGDRLLRDGPDGVLFVRPTGRRAPGGLPGSANRESESPASPALAG